MSYQIVFHPDAADEFDDLPLNVKRQFRVVLNQLKTDPLHPDSKGLAGRTTKRRVSVPGYALVYEFVASQLVILVVRVRPARPALRGNR